MNTSMVKYLKIDASTYLSSNNTPTIVPVKYQPPDTKMSCAIDNNIHDMVCTSNNNIDPWYHSIKQY